MRPTRKDAYKLFHEGTLALADVERNGIKIDVPYLKNQSEKIKKRIQKNQDLFIQSELGIAWKSVFKEKTNFDSGFQLSKLFQILGIKVKNITEKGNISVDEKSLNELVKSIPEIDILLRMRKLKKLEGTYIKNILESCFDGYCHPSFNLHKVRTYRSSCSEPNFQNIPIRDKEIGNIIRRAFIPRQGRKLLECDYTGIEVRIACCYHKDPVMVSYIKDKTKDLHRDMAMQCYSLDKDQITKDIRYCGKNKFVFPQFYGDYYVNCAKNLWEAIDEMDLKTAQNIPIKEHLSSSGIKTYSAFEKHIQKVEKDFWEVKFKKYTEWKKLHYKRYLQYGYFDTLTGFRCSGLMSRNDVINYPVQGSAFHCLLWSLIQVQNILKEKNMKSLIVGQIHDSIILDIESSEEEEICEILKNIMTKKIIEHWDWIIVPLDIEIEITPINGSWNEKKEKSK